MDDMNHCAKCGAPTKPGNLLCPYHLGEYWRTQGHTSISPICPNPVADNQDAETLEQLRARLERSRTALEDARRVMFDVLASVDDGVCRAVGCCMPRDPGSFYCGDHARMGVRVASNDDSR